jgi:hypothetical protein
MSNRQRPSLAESMRAVAAEPPVPISAPAAPQSRAARVFETPPAIEPTRSPAARAEQRPRAFYAATRVGKKKATATLSGDAHRQLKTLAVEQGGTVEGLLIEAINDLFRKHGKDPIA